MNIKIARFVIYLFEAVTLIVEYCSSLKTCKERTRSGSFSFKLLHFLFGISLVSFLFDHAFYSIKAFPQLSPLIFQRPDSYCSIATDRDNFLTVR